VHEQVLDQIMVANLNDNQQSWQLDGTNGAYHRLAPADAAAAFNLHAYFMTNPSLSGRGTALHKQRPQRVLRIGHD
jgi:polyphosphate kinase